MINLSFAWATRAFGNLISQVNALPTSVKGVAAIAFLIFSVKTAYQAGSSWYNRTWKKVAPLQKNLPSPNEKTDKIGKIDNFDSGQAREILNRLAANEPEKLLDEAPALLAHLKKVKDEDFLSDSELLSLIPLIEGAIRHPSFLFLNLNASEQALKNMSLYELLHLIISRKKVFPAGAANLLLYLSYNSPRTFKSLILDAVQEGRAFPPFKGDAAICIFIEKMQKFEEQEQFQHYLSDLFMPFKVREQMLMKAFSEEPLGETDGDISYAKLALHFAHPSNSPPLQEDKRNTALQKVAALLLRTSPGYVVRAVLYMPHEQLMPILTQALLNCPEQQFLESFSKFKNLEFTKVAIDQILNRLFSMEKWTVAKLEDILFFLGKTRGGRLTHLEITLILRWIKANPNPEHLARAYLTLSGFADMPVFLNQLPLREDLKPHIVSILGSLCTWPALQLNDAQQVFYCPRDSNSNPHHDSIDLPEIRSVCARFFPKAFTQIKFREWTPWRQGEQLYTEKLKLISNALDIDENLVFFRKQWMEFIDVVSENYQVSSEGVFFIARVVLQILLKMAKECPVNEKYWFKQPECKSFFQTVLDNMLFVRHPRNRASNEHPAVLLLLGELAKCAPQLFHQTNISWANLFYICIPPCNAKEAAQILNALAYIAKAVANDDLSFTIADRFPLARFKELCQYSFSSSEDVALALEAKQIIEVLYGIRLLPIRFDLPLPRKLMSRAEKGYAGTRAL